VYDDDNNINTRSRVTITGGEVCDKTGREVCADQSSREKKTDVRWIYLARERVWDDEKNSRRITPPVSRVGRDVYVDFGQPLHTCRTRIFHASHVHVNTVNTAASFTRVARIYRVTHTALRHRRKRENVYIISRFSPTSINHLFLLCNNNTSWSRSECYYWCTCHLLVRTFQSKV